MRWRLFRRRRRLSFLRPAVMPWTMYPFTNSPRPEYEQVN